MLATSHSTCTRKLHLKAADWRKQKPRYEPKKNQGIASPPIGAACRYVSSRLTPVQFVLGSDSFCVSDTMGATEFHVCR
jgi:hypothetical protein